MTAVEVIPAVDEVLEPLARAEWLVADQARTAVSRAEPASLSTQVDLRCARAARREPDRCRLPAVGQQLRAPLGPAWKACKGGEPDRDIIESVIVDHSTGIRVLLAPPSPEGADLVTPPYLRKMIEMLKGLGAAVPELTGVDDPTVVVTEPFVEWDLAGDFVGGTMALADGVATMSMSGGLVGSSNLAACQLRRNARLASASAPSATSPAPGR